MNNNKIFMVLIAVTTLVGCSKYLDINTDPNVASEPPISGLLAHVTNATAINTFNISNITSYYTQYLSSPNPASDDDIYNSINPNTAWGGIYDVMTDLYDMKNLGEQKKFASYQGVADILLAYNLSIASNIWGDMPFSESFSGVNNLKPTFDKAEQLYNNCLSLLDSGIIFMQQAETADSLLGKSDFIHTGSKSGWIKTAYALEARLLNQVSKQSSYSADKILSVLSKAYTSNADDAQVVQFDGYNPWFNVATSNANLLLDGWLSSYFVNAANGNTYGPFDPRLALITDTTKYGDYRGTTNGKGRIGTGTNHEECYLTTDKWYSSIGAPLQLLTYSECKFIEAEVDFRSGNKADAYTAYLNGITASMQKLGVNPQMMNAYIQSPIVSVGKENISLELILKEKYIACFLSPVTWDDMRRTDYKYKNFSLPVNAVLDNFIRRVDYPSNEISRNGGNVPTVQLSDKLWWDN